MSLAEKRSRLPTPVLERLARITTSLLFLFPQFDELARFPAPLVFRRPLAHHVLEFAGLDHLTSDFGTEYLVMALAARFAVVVHQFVALGHALQEVLVADAALTGQDFRQFQRLLSRPLVVFGRSLGVRFSLLAHGCAPDAVPETGSTVVPPASLALGFPNPKAGPPHSIYYMENATHAIVPQQGGA
jgi:hypothetical protein